ncbi:hypothetical protein CAOG_007615 [Capsaspora owczarzaki ATCC 30864]|uniref:HIT domain-containing protein n=2 Tax=Capsaspora owczarzaki (strain ATCC 30864) TaxID=595528 RepID=A0A0D2WW57_CAPO3|nr:hypothetical protein CAOG_007615 [Capsaspora owczarzaki ATCC 30864]
MGASSSTESSSLLPSNPPQIASAVDTTRRACVFCDIARGELPHADNPAATVDAGSMKQRAGLADLNRIVYRDDTVAVFHDRHPKASLHLLVVPVAHVRNTDSLRQSAAHYALVQRMLEQGQRCVEDQVRKTITAQVARHRAQASGGTGEALSIDVDSQVAECVRQARYGFHVPPFTSVSHLHLHCLVPPFRNGIFCGLGSLEVKYRDDLPWFEAVATTLARLQPPNTAVPVVPSQL